MMLNPILANTVYMDYVSVGLIVIFGVFVLIGAFTGFLKMLIQLAESILSILVAILFARPVGMALYKIGLFNFFEGKVSETLVNTNEFFSNVITSTNKAEVIEQGIEALKIPSIIAGMISSIGEKFVPVTNDLTIANYLASALFVAISVSLAAILLFTIIRISMFFLKKIVDKLDKLKLIGAINHLLGAIIGGVNGIIVVIIAVIILSFLMMIPSISAPIADVIKLNEEGTWTLAKWLYLLNPLGIILKLIGLG